MNILIEPEEKRFLESKPLKTNTAARKNVKNVAPLKLNQKKRNSSNIKVEEILYIDYSNMSLLLIKICFHFSKFVIIETIRIPLSH